MDIGPDATIDPYRPDATIDERTDHILGALLSDENPARRYHTIQALQAGRLRDVAAISLRQLRDQHGTTEAAATAVGITRQAANELLAKADAGAGAREDRNARNEPTYRLGRHYAAIEATVLAIPTTTIRERQRDRWDGLLVKATQTLTVLPAVTEAAHGWLQTVRQRYRPDGAAKADQLAAAMGDHLAAIAAWVADRTATAPELTIREQSEVWLGYHHERVRGRQERQARAAGVEPAE